VVKYFPEIFCPVISQYQTSQLEMGGHAPPRKKRSMEKDKISILFGRFKDGDLYYSLSDYLDAIKYCNTLVV